MFVTLKVFKLIGPSNDGQRHGRGTYLFSKKENIGFIARRNCSQSTIWHNKYHMILSRIIKYLEKTRNRRDKLKV
jgi:predicted RNA-binding protein YlxR (DUF448 family)